MMTCGELTERMISLKVNLSTGLMDGLSLSKRFMMMLNRVLDVNTCKKSGIQTIETHSFSFSVKNLESYGVEGTTKKPRRPTTIENNPSYISSWGDCKETSKVFPIRTTMKIQAHPDFPPMPSMFTIPAASNPEKAPESYKRTLAPKISQKKLYITHRNCREK